MNNVCNSDISSYCFEHQYCPTLIVKAYNFQPNLKTGCVCLLEYIALLNDVIPNDHYF